MGAGKERETSIDSGLSKWHLTYFMLNASVSRMRQLCSSGIGLAIPLYMLNFGGVGTLSSVLRVMISKDFMMHILRSSGFTCCFIAFYIAQ